MTFSNKAKYLNHEKMHDQTKDFKCSLCFQGFFKEVTSTKFKPLLHHLEVLKILGAFKNPS